LAQAISSQAGFAGSPRVPPTAEAAAAAMFALAPRLWVAAAVAALTQWGPAGAEKVQVVNGVMKLETNNFDSALEKFPLLMVNFYAPWCGGCNGFHPKYEKAARYFKKMDMPAPRLAKVDVTVEPKLEKRLGIKVSTWPIVQVYKNGTFYGNFTGEYEKDDVIEYMSTVDKPAIVGASQRWYNMLRSQYKKVVEELVPKKHRKLAIELFPLALVLSVLAAWLVVSFCTACFRCCRSCGRCCCRCCCRKRSGQGEASPSGDGDPKKEEDKKTD